ncbi:MAG: pyridoxamine 5'-phosphate oxidase family protein [Gammaproteobacteria bacterium]
MATQREQLWMSAGEVDAFLRSHWTMVLGTIGRDHQPHLVTMAYGFFEGCLAFTSYAKAQKMVNIRRDPRITCLVEDIGSAYAEIRGVQITGHAEVIDDAARVLAVLECVRAQMVSTGRASPDTGATPDYIAAKRLAVKLRVGRTISWDHGRLGGKY